MHIPKKVAEEEYSGRIPDDDALVWPSWPTWKPFNNCISGPKKARLWLTAWHNRFYKRGWSHFWSTRICNIFYETRGGSMALENLHKFISFCGRGFPSVWMGHACLSFWFWDSVSNLICQLISYWAQWCFDMTVASTYWLIYSSINKYLQILQVAQILQHQTSSTCVLFACTSFWNQNLNRWTRRLVALMDSTCPPCFHNSSGLLLRILSCLILDCYCHHATHESRAWDSNC